MNGTLGNMSKEELKRTLLAHFRNYPGSVSVGIGMQPDGTSNLQLRIYRKGNPPPEKIPQMWGQLPVVTKILDDLPRAQLKK